MSLNSLALTLLIVASLLRAAGYSETDIVTAPAQPVSGPGGSEVRFESVEARWDESSSPGNWVVEPTGPEVDAARLGELPIVVFLGGCCMPDNTSAVIDFYKVWIDHLVQRGAIVVYPIYRFSNASADVARIVGVALAELDESGKRAPGADHVGLVGHSYGGLLAASYGASAEAAELPAASFVMAASPGCLDCTFPGNLPHIPDTTFLLVVVGADDSVVGDDGAQRIWEDTRHIPPGQRTFIRLSSDHHGEPALIADHGMPTTGPLGDPNGGDVDALDWFGTWKFVDALLSCAVEHRDCDYVLGNSEELRFMGVWSDGQPVTEAQVVEGS